MQVFHFQSPLGRGEKNGNLAEILVFFSKELKMRVALAVVLAQGALAQDPATGWMAYAVGAIPSTFDRITSLEVS